MLRRREQGERTPGVLPQLTHRPGTLGLRPQRAARRGRPPHLPRLGRPGGKALARSGLLQLDERLGQAAKVGAVWCSPHLFRPTFAVSLIRNGGSAFSLTEMLGHTSLARSNRYLALAEADLESQHQRFSPVATMPVATMKDARR
jgi:integrase